MKKSKLLMASMLAIGALASLAACNNPTGSSENSSQGDVTSSHVEDSSTVEESSEEVVTSSTSGHVHNLTRHPEVPATCTVDGNIEYYTCDGDDCAGKYFDASGNEILWRDTIIPAGHKVTKHDAVSGLMSGSDEYYECTVCHKYFSDEEAYLEIEEGSWANHGYALHWDKGERMGTKEFYNEVKLADIEGKAIAFDFIMIENGTNELTLCQTTANTYNISGTFAITKADDTYTSTKGIITDVNEEGKEGWKTITINRSEFDGDGMALHGADGADVICGAWDHEAGHVKDAVSEMYIDPTSLRAADHTGIFGIHYDANAEINTHFPTAYSHESLQGKAIQFDLKLEGDGIVHLTFFGSDWKNNTGDICIERTGDEYKTNKGQLTVCDAKPGYMTFTHNFDDFDGDGLTTTTSHDVYVIYCDRGRPTVGCYLDWNDTRIVDAVAGSSLKIVESWELVKISPTISREELAGKSLSFNVYFATASDSQVKISLYDTVEANDFVRDIVVSQTSGAYSATYGTLDLHATITPLGNGIVNVQVPELILSSYGSFGKATVGNVLRVWPEGGTTPGCGAYRDSFAAVKSLIGQTADNINLGYEVLASDLEGQSLCFDLYIPTEDDATFKMSLFDVSWGKGYMCDAFVYQRNGALSFAQGTKDAYATFSAKVDGWVTVSVNTASLTLGNGAGVADKFAWLMLWEAPQGCGIDPFSFRAGEASRMLKVAGGWELPSISPVVTKADLVGKQLSFDVHFASEADSQVKISLYDTIEANDFVRDIIVHQVNGTHNATYGAADLKATITPLNGGDVNVKVPEVILTKLGAFGAASVANVVRVWPESDTTAGCGVYRDSFCVGKTFIGQTPDNINLGYEVSAADLDGKALSFDLYVPTDEDVSFKMSLFDVSWGKGYMCDAFIYQRGGVFSFAQGVNEAVATFSDKVDGWVTVSVNTASLTLGNGAGVADKFAWLMLWEAPQGCGIDPFSFRAGIAAKMLKVVGGWELPSIYQHITKTDLVGHSLAFDVYFASEADSQVKISLYDTVETNAFVRDIVITQSNKSYVVTYGGVNLHARCKAMGDGVVHVSIDESFLAGYGAFGDATVANVVRVWPEGGTTAGCGVYRDSFTVGAHVFYDLSCDANVVINSGFVKAIKASDLVGHAFAFDFVMDGDGVLPFTLFSSDWKNMSGQIQIIRSGSSYKITEADANRSVGKVVPGEGGYMTAIINDFAFHGDGKAIGSDIKVIYGDGNVAPTTGCLIDIASARIVDRVEQFQGGDDNWHPIAPFTKAELQGKSLQFRVYIPTSDDSTIKISFTENAWTNTMIYDMFIYQTSGSLSMNQAGNIDAQFSEKVNGWITVTVSGDALTYGEGVSAGSIITWASITSGCGVDVASFKVVA